MAAEPLLEVTDLEKSFRVSRGAANKGGQGYVHAVRKVSFSVRRGETLGLVGETGCGKSTIARCIVGLTPPSGGSIRLNGQELTALGRAQWRAVRPRLQIVFQNPYLSLDPKMTVLAIVQEPLSIHRLGTKQEVSALARRTLAAVGIGEREMAARPASLSGGQRQRVAIARALVLDPEIVILDEPVSALDVSIQAQVTNLLVDLQHQRGVSYVVILHDLAVASQMCERVAVIYLGKVVEIGKSEDVLTAPVHPYSRGLLDAAPRLGVGIGAASTRPATIIGEVSHETISGCRFRPRCPVGRDRDICAQVEPGLTDAQGDAHLVACHFADELADRRPGETRR